MDIPLYNALELFDRIADDQFVWPLDEEVPRRTGGVHHVDKTTLLVTQMEALTKVRQPYSNCEHVTSAEIGFRRVRGRSYYRKTSFSFHTCNPA